MRAPAVVSRGIMEQIRVRVRNFLFAGLLVGFALSGTNSSSAADFDLESAGARAGIGANGVAEHMSQVEAFAILNLPLAWWNDGHWQLQTRLEMTAGWLGGEGENAVIGSMGPGMLLNLGKTHLSLEVGFSPTLVSRHRYGPLDIGSDLQFTTHIGLNYDIGKHFRIDYRFQHMSNGGLSHPNPGLNMHLFGVSYLF
jgi:lipid A 3-O-deacylase